MPRPLAEWPTKKILSLFLRFSSPDPGANLKSPSSGSLGQESEKTIQPSFDRSRREVVKVAKIDWRLGRGTQMLPVVKASRDTGVTADLSKGIEASRAWHEDDMVTGRGHCCLEFLGLFGQSEAVPVHIGW